MCLVHRPALAVLAVAAAPVQAPAAAEAAAPAVVAPVTAVVHQVAAAAVRSSLSVDTGY